MVFTWYTNCTFHCIFNQSHCEWALSIIGLSFQFKLNSVDDKNLKASIFHRFIGPSGFWTQPLLIGSRSLSTVQSSVLGTGTGISGNPLSISHFGNASLSLSHWSLSIQNRDARRCQIGLEGSLSEHWPNVNVVCLLLFPCITRAYHYRAIMLYFLMPDIYHR